MEYGVRWTQAVGRTMSIVTKEKFFRTAKARDAYVLKLTEKDGFIEVLAWCDPPGAPPAAVDDFLN